MVAAAEKLRIFQSTPSAWRVTQLLAQVKLAVFISIHTLRMEGDVLLLLF